MNKKKTEVKHVLPGVLEDEKKQQKKHELGPSDENDKKKKAKKITQKFFTTRILSASVDSITG